MGETLALGEALLKPLPLGECELLPELLCLRVREGHCETESVAQPLEVAEL